MHLRRASAARPSLATCYRASGLRVCRPPRHPVQVHRVPRPRHTGRTASLPHYDACHHLPGLFTKHCCGITSPRSPRGPCALSIPLSLGPEVSSASSSSTCRQSNFVSSFTKVSVSSVDKQTYWDTPPPRSSKARTISLSLSTVEHPSTGRVDASLANGIDDGDSAEATLCWHVGAPWDPRRLRLMGSCTYPIAT